MGDLNPFRKEMSDLDELRSELGRVLKGYGDVCDVSVLARSCLAIMGRIESLELRQADLAKHTFAPILGTTTADLSQQYTESNLRDEILRLDKHVADLTLERDFLSKANGVLGDSLKSLKEKMRKVIE